MKINTIKGITRSLGITLAAGTLAFTAPKIKAQTSIQNQTVQKDTFTHTTPTVTAAGVNDTLVLMNAPNPNLKIAGERKIATFVVDLATNTLYHYDEKGKPLCAYLVASGKASTPTSKGVRIVSHVETYPYKTAPVTTKRYKNPRDYGPKAIILKKLDPITGTKSRTGEFIHGNRDASSIGKYISKGCIRMDNEVIKKLAKVAKHGSIIIIK